MRILFTVAFALAALPAAAQTATTQPLTMERVFSDPSLSGPRPRAATFSPDGRSITFLQPRADDSTVLDLAAEPVEGGGARVLLDARALADDSNLSEAERARRERMRISARGVVTYQWDDQGRAILAPVGGDLFVADVSTGTVRRLTETATDEIGALFSPEGRYIGFVRDQDLYVIDTTSGAERRLTEDGGGAISNGVAEFVVQEEFDRFSGFWFAPGDQRIAFTRTDESAVPLIQRPEVNASGVTVVEQRYPRAGAANATVELFILDLNTGERREVDLGNNPDVYLVRVNWSHDGSALYAQRVSRDQRRLDLLRIDPVTGASRVVLSETARHWINVNNGFHALEDGGFLWISERDGFAHVYRYNERGRLLRQLTRGNWPVRKIAGFNEARGELFIVASTETPIEQHLYRVSLSRQVTPQRITEGAGLWSVEMNDDASAYIGTYSDVSTPSRVSLHASDGRFIRWLEENALDADHPFAPYVGRYPEPRFGTISAPGAPNVALHYRMDLPVNFDPARRYPVIVKVYGGPHGQTVSRTWTNPRDLVYLERGYILFALDNRGSYNRGAAFEAALGGRFGDVEVRDHLAGLAFLESQPFVDPDRIGVTGWSYGGYLTLMLMTAAPEAFDAGVSGAPVTDWRLYDTAYTERYLGMPDALGGIYALSSPLGGAANVSRPLLIVHGMADDNVTFDNTTQFIAALQQANVPFEMMAYPGQRHGLYSRWASRHAAETTLNFFDRTIGNAGAAQD
jgi:dipeptidyl-peptidase-4